MLDRLNHVAIAVPAIEPALAPYRGALGVSIGPVRDQPDHGVRTAFLELPNTVIEFLEPLGEDSPIARFLVRNPAGGMHHLCYEVADLDAAIGRLTDHGARALGRPGTGAHGNRVVFLHPADFSGVLIELEEAPS